MSKCGNRMPSMILINFSLSALSSLRCPSRASASSSAIDLTTSTGVCTFAGCRAAAGDGDGAAASTGKAEPARVSAKAKATVRSMMYLLGKGEARHPTTGWSEGSECALLLVRRPVDEKLADQILQL